MSVDHGRHGNELLEELLAHGVHGDALHDVGGAVQPDDFGEREDGVVQVKVGHGNLPRGGHEGLWAVVVLFLHLHLLALLQDLLLIVHHLVGLTRHLHRHGPLGSGRGLGAQVELGRQQTQQLVQLHQALLQVLVLLDLELHSDHVAVDAVRVKHRLHRQQILEHLAVLAVVGELHVAVLALGQRVADHLDGFRLRVGALQEATIASRGLLLRISSGAAELLVHEHHRRTGNGHVGDDDARGEGLGGGHEYVQPVVSILRGSIVHLIQHAFDLLAVAALLEGTQHVLTVLGLHESWEGVKREHLESCFSFFTNFEHRRLGVNGVSSCRIHVVPHLLGRGGALLLSDALSACRDEHLIHRRGRLRLRHRVHCLQLLCLQEELQLGFAVLGLKEAQEGLLSHLKL
mmetsp:Transcript_15504/g.21210  ORF Transcript_15504/g.21210 Transcript_15504/m.21210 type:complete len:403 (+) Transcript_15504:1809-3017(+)